MALLEVTHQDLQIYCGDTRPNSPYPGVSGPWLGRFEPLRWLSSEEGASPLLPDPRAGLVESEAGQSLFSQA